MSSQDSDDVVKGLLNVDAVLGRGLDKLAAELPRKGVALLCGDLSVRHAVTLVSDEHDGDRGCRADGGDGRAGVRRRRGRRLLDPLNLVVEALDARERRARRHAVDENEALAVADPLVAQRCVLFLSGRVEHFEHAGLVVNHGLLAVGIFDGWVVLLPESVRWPYIILIKRGELVRTVSTKCCRQSWIVRAVLPTPPSPSTTSL